MRIYVRCSLLAYTGLEPGEPQLRYFVEASATVRDTPSNRVTPGCRDIVDHEIDEVLCHWLGYGDRPQRSFFTGVDPVDRQANNEASDYLNHRLADRDDWRAVIEAAVTRELHKINPREFAET